MQERAKKTQSCVMLSLIVSASMAMPQAMAGGKTCVRDGGNITEVCVEWSLQSNPIRNTHFAVDFSDPDDPDVQLLEGNLGWIVTSTVVSSGNPANIGDLTISPNGSGHNFGVAIANGSGAGAANVAKFDLTAGGGWSGYSAINGGSITGNLIGDLKAKKSGSSGGSVTFTIGGNMSGNIDVDHIAAGGLTITGDFGSTSVRRNITIGEIKEGNLSIGDLIEAAINVTTLDGKTIEIAESADATLIANQSQIQITTALNVATISKPCRAGRARFASWPQSARGYGAPVN